MSNKHTPGPWTVDYKTLKNARGESIASAGNNRKVWGDELDASLRLAAAAPELLEALQRLVDLNCPLTGTPSHNDLVEHWNYEKTQGRGEADDQLFALMTLAKAKGLK